MQPKALITGITGQDGTYLSELLLSKGYEVHGMVRYEPRSPEVDPRVHLTYGELTDSSVVRRIVDTVEPDEVYNLGAQSHVQVSFEMPEHTVDADAMGALRLLEAIRGSSAKFYQASSSEMFGDVVESPQTEVTPFRPQSPYASAKVCAYWLTKNYRQALGLFASNGILFNHESPCRGDMFVTRKITKAAARIKLGLQDKLMLGNLESKRDWGFAGDYVEAMWLMLQQKTPGDYVVATGESHTVREFMELAFDRLGLNWRKHVAVDERLFRPAEVNELLGDASKARRELGWKPRVRFEKLVEMMVDADLDLARRELSSRPPKLRAVLA